MLKSLHLFFFLAFSCSVLVQMAFAQSSASSGDWNQTATWAGGAVPTSTGVVIILNAHTVSINSNQTCANITVNVGGTLVVKFGAGARTLTVTSNNTSTGNIIVNGTLDLAEGADSANVVWTSTHNNTKTLGGTGSITFNSLTISHTNSTSGLTFSTLSGALTGNPISGRINTVGNLNINSFLNLQRGLLISGSTQDATQTHNIGQVRIGSVTSNYTISNVFCLSVTLTANTAWTLNNGVRTITTVNVAGDVVSDNTIGATASNGASISMCGPDARGGNIAAQDAAPPTSSKTTLKIGGSLILNEQFSLGGNGVFAAAGTTQPMDSLILDIGKNFTWSAVPTLSACSNTFKPGFVGYAAGFGHSGVSYPVFKFRGGTAVDPAILDVNPLFWTTLSSHAADATCHWRIEQGAYVQIAATSGICIREGRSIRINGTLDMLDGSQLVSSQVGTCGSAPCIEPIVGFGTIGRLIVRDPDGIGNGTVLINTASRPAITVNGTFARFVTIGGMATSGIVEYAGSSAQIFTPRSYFRLFLNQVGTIDPQAGTYTISNSGELRIPTGTTLRMNPSGSTAWTIGATNTTLIVPTGAELQTNGASINGFARYSNGSIAGARGSTLLSSAGYALLSGTIRMNGTAADEVIPAAVFENLRVDKGAFSANLSNDTAVMRGSLQIQTGAVGFGASGTLLLEKGFNDLGGGPIGTLTGSTNANLIIAGDAIEPNFAMPAITGSVLARLTVNRTLGTTISSPLSLNNGLYLTNGPLSIGSSANLSMSTNSTIFRTIGTIDVAPTLLAICNLTYQGPATITTGEEFLPTTLTALTISAGANVTQSGDKTIVGNMVISPLSGALGAGVYSIDANTLALSSLTATLTNSGTFNGGATSNLNLSGSTATAFTLTNVVGGLNNLTINRPLTLGASAPLTVIGLTTFTSIRAISIGTNTFTANGTFTGTGSFTGTATSILTVGGSGALGGTITWPVTLNTLNHNRPSAPMSFGASTHTTVNHNAGSTLAYTAAATITTLNVSAASNTSVTGAGIITNLNLSGASIMTTANNLTSTNLVISGASSLTMNTAGIGTITNFDLEIGSTFSASGRAVSFNGTTNFAGTITHSAASIFTIGDFGGAQPQWNWPSTLKPFVGTFNINRATGAVFGTASTVTNLGLQAGSLTHGGNLTIANAGIITRSLGSMDVAPIFAGTATAVYGVGTTANITTGPEMRSSITQLTINMGANGAVTLDKNVTVTALTFTTGCLNVGGFDLSMASAAAIAGLTAVRYIEADGAGGFIRTGISGVATLTTPILFPIGTSVSSGGTYSPVRIGNTAALTVKARVRDFICSGNANTCGTSIANTVKKTWEVDVISGTPLATFDVGWTAAAETGTFNRVNPVGIFRYNSGTGRWVQFNATSVTAITNTIATARVTAKAQFSPHGMANQGGVLPVVIASISAEQDGRNGRINWTTALEQNNKGWTIEKSKDALNYTAIGFVNGAGNSSGTLSYTYLDERLDGTTYYRLKQEDFDGTIDYSPVVEIAPKGLGNLSFNLYPNPSRGEVKLTYVGMAIGGKAYQISITDAAGKIVSNASGTIDDICSWMQHYSPKLSSGLYMIRVSDQNQVINLKLAKE